MASQTQLLQNELSQCHEQIDKLNQSLEEKDRQIQNLLTSLQDMETVLRHTQNLLTKQLNITNAYMHYVDSVDEARTRLSNKLKEV